MASKLDLHIWHHNRLFRECLASALAGDDSRNVQATGEPEFGAPEAPGKGDRVVLLVDAGLPDSAAFRLVRSVRAAGRDIRIILMVPSSAPELVDSCVKADVDGCVADDDSLDHLRQGIEAVLSGQKYGSPRFLDRLFGPVDGIGPSSNWGTDGRGRELTMREDEILTMLVKELSNKQIARELSLSIYTVKNHLHRIYEKLGVEDRQAAVRHAVRRSRLSRSIG